MTKRKAHPDNALIDELTAQATPSQGSRSGGNVSRDVGTRSELHHATGEAGGERETKQDNPVDAEMKGTKSIERLDPSRKGPGSKA